MNQILTFNTSASSEKQLKKVIKHFSIFIILFAIVFIAEGAYGSYKFKNNPKELSDTPELTIQRNNGITILEIYSDIGVQKIIYSWNDGIEDTIECGGENSLTKEISTSIGINDLNIKIIDSDGNKITYDPVKIKYEENTTEETNNTEENWEEAVKTDTTAPTVDVKLENGKVVITAVDDVKMAYVTYTINGGEETKITGLSEDEKTLTTEIETQKIQKGENKLVINAYDKAGNVKTLEKVIQGANGAEIAVNQDEDKLVVKVTNETINITKIVYSLNGEEKTIEDVNSAEYTFEINMVDGENKISISAYAGTLKSDYENTFQKKVYGTNGPKIQVGKQDGKIIVAVSDSNNIVKIKYKFNEEEKVIDNINQKEYSFDIDMVDGENKIEIYAYSDTDKSEYKGKTTK